ncbi:hypothetical protein R5R35_003493 [Gryllus longicercus]|uniref:Anaphase-promoting complex subunit CDC26 n=1 Tax=Gryllus longicercus TaxID=2509291 RepID=A0AAN9Z6N6_9ORTH
MIRRSPTRIEVKLDDLQEYENMRREQEARKEQQQNNSVLGEAWAPGASKLPQAVVHDRIGYAPQPRLK